MNLECFIPVVMLKEVTVSGLVLGPHVKDKVMISVRYVDNRMIMVRIQGIKVDLLIAQIYMPQSGLADEEAE